MKVEFVLGIVVLGLLGSCTKESDTGVSEQEKPAREGRAAEPIHAGEQAGPVAEAEEYPEGASGEEQAGGGWLSEFEAAPTPDAKIAVIERKQIMGPEMLVPLIRRALLDPDERVRIEAVKVVGSFAGMTGSAGGTGESGPAPTGGAAGSEAAVEVGELVELVAAAVEDPSSEVRAHTMEAVVELSPETRVEVYRRTIEASDDQIRKMTLTQLGRIMSKPAFEVLMSGLRQPGQEFRKEVNLELKLLVNREFDSFEEARTWWDGNSIRYNDSMAEIGDGK